MRKVNFSILIILVIFTFTACSSPNNATPSNALSDNIDTLRESIGKTKAETFDGLNIDENKDVETNEKITGGYVLKEEQKFAGENFTLIIHFDKNSEIMYGFTYAKDYENDLEEGYKLTKRLQNDLTEEYGEPTTYPELPNRIAKMPSYDKIKTGDSSDYKETWKVDDEVSVTLQMKYISDTGIRVEVQYAIQAPALRTGK